MVCTFAFPQGRATLHKYSFLINMQQKEYIYLNDVEKEI